MLFLYFSGCLSLNKIDQKELSKYPELNYFIDPLSTIQKYFQKEIRINTIIPDSIEIIDDNEIDVINAHLISKYAGAAYCKDDNIKNWKCRGYCNNLTNNTDILSIQSSTLTGGRYFLSANHNIKALILSFRGSFNARNWALNLNFRLTDSFGLTHESGTKIHYGFNKIMQSLSQDYIIDLRIALRRYKDYKVILTGHSMGGAIAILAALDIHIKMDIGWDKLEVITYGQPRVGNEEFVRYINKLPLKLSRIVNYNDLVPHVPNRFLGYVHYHQELWFNSYNFIQKCNKDSNEDNSCSNSIVIPNIFSHLYIWDTIFGIIC